MKKIFFLNFIFCLIFIHILCTNIFGFMLQRNTNFPILQFNDINNELVTITNIQKPYIVTFLTRVRKGNQKLLFSE